MTHAKKAVTKNHPTKKSSSSLKSKNIHPLDAHYQNLQHEMLATLQILKLAA